MISEPKQDQAALYLLGELSAHQQSAFERELRESEELRNWVHGLQRAILGLVLSIPREPLPSELKGKVAARIQSLMAAAKVAVAATPEVSSLPGLRFLRDASGRDWRELPIQGAYVKLLSLERERGYAVLLGKLDPGTVYPAHINAGPEEFFILAGDLHIGSTRLGAGDFHHADGGSQHEINHSKGGCTLLAVLTTDDPLVEFALAGV